MMAIWGPGSQKVKKKQEKRKRGHILSAAVYPKVGPLRLQLAGGVYHVTSRGDGRDDIYLSDDDRDAWLEVFGPLLCTLACIIQRSVGRSKIMKKKEG